jgi:chitinase
MSNFILIYLNFILDIDWEFPATGDKQNFVLLLKAIKKRFGPIFSLSAAVTPGKNRINVSYDIPEIFSTVDFVNLMTYNFHGSWETYTGLHSAMYRGLNDTSPFNVDESVKYILENWPQIDKNKIILAIPNYGRRWILDSNENNGIGAPAKAHPVTTEPYRLICKNIRAGNYSYHWDDEQKTPYIISGNDWMSYDDLRSVAVKSNYIVKNGLGGAMFWSLEQDDHEGLCGQGKYPLISTVSSIISDCPSVCLKIIPKVQRILKHDEF